MTQDTQKLVQALELLLAKVRRDAPELSGKLLGHCDAVLAAHRSQPSPSQDADRLDAERYRWLRDPKNATRDEWNSFGPYSTAEEIDAAIDAARLAEKGKV
jgi:hypothetical protein